MLCKRCPAYSGHDFVSGSFLGTAGTSHHNAKEEVQVTEFMSMRVPMCDTGTEQLVVVLKCL